MRNIHHYVTDENNKVVEYIYQDEIGIYEMILDNIRIYKADWEDKQMKHNYIEQTFEQDDDLGEMTKERLGELIDAALIESEQISNE